MGGEWRGRMGVEHLLGGCIASEALLQGGPRPAAAQGMCPLVNKELGPAVLQCDPGHVLGSYHLQARNLTT